MVDRTRSLAAQAPEALADVPLPPKEGFRRWVAREPLGVVLDIAPWNYPLLTAVNAVVPAVLAGNGVLLKPSRRTPLCGDQFASAFAAAGAPPGLVSSVFADHATFETLMAGPEVGHLAFTGSVDGGHAVSRALSARFLGATLELGGKDAAYVAEDADLDHAIANLADGAFYNAGPELLRHQADLRAPAPPREVPRRPGGRRPRYRLANPRPTARRSARWPSPRRPPP